MKKVTIVTSTYKKEEWRPGEYTERLISESKKDVDPEGQWLTREQVEQLCDIRADWERQLGYHGSNTAYYYEKEYNEELDKLFKK